MKLDIVSSTQNSTFNRTAYGIEILLPSSPFPGMPTFNRTAYGIEI